MTTPLERRYRRLLRLLPAGYREIWEDDMTAAFLDAAGPEGRSRPSLGERVSVVALAVRLRLAGAHTSPRGLVWRRAVHGFALVALLYQALTSSVAVGHVVWFVVSHGAGGLGAVDAGPLVDIVTPTPLWGIVSLSWVGAFVCLVLRRLAAARVLVLVAAASSIGIAIGYGTMGLSDPWRARDIVPWAWLGVSVAAVLVAARDARPRASLWLGGYLIGALVLIPADEIPAVFAYLTVETVASLVLLLAMVLVLAVPATRRAGHWPLALAPFGIAAVAVPMLTLGPTRLGPPVVDVALAGVGLLCAVAGLMALLRPHAERGAPASR